MSALAAPLGINGKTVDRWLTLLERMFVIRRVPAWHRVEVDFVLESVGKIVGLAVKAAASLRPNDFHGLRRLREATGKAFACGIVLHDGERIQGTGNGLFAMPVSSLWTEIRF